MSERRAEDGWIQHDGKGCPVDEGATVELKNKRGWLITAPARIIKWENVTAYRVVPA